MRTATITLAELLPTEDERALTCDERERLLAVQRQGRTELDDPISTDRQWAHRALAAAGLL